MESFSATFERHKGLFNGFNEGEKREERFRKQFELRKSRRMDETYKKRNLRNVEIEWINIEKFPAEEYCVEKLQEYVECIKDGNRKVNLAGVYGIRRILSQPKMNPIQQVIDSGVVNLLNPFMFLDEYPQLQYETAWLLTNMFTGTSDQIEYILKRGCITGLTHMLNSSITEVKEQVFWALGNIATESGQYRDHILRPSIFPNLISIVMSGLSPIRLVKQGCWTLSCICRTLPVPSELHCKQMIPPLNKGLLMHSEIGGSLQYILQAIISITCTYPVLIDYFIEEYILETLISFVLNKSNDEVFYSLKIIGNFIAGSDLQTGAVVKAGGIKVLALVLKSDEAKLRREAMWSISNLCAGNSLQIDALWKSGIIKSVISCIGNEVYEVQKEVPWVLFNLVNNDFFYIDELVNLGLFQGLKHLITLKDTKMTMVCLECVDKCLEQAQSDSEVFMHYIEIIQNIDFVDVLESLQTHPNKKVYYKALKILETYLGSESEYQSLIENIKELTPYNI